MTGEKVLIVDDEADIQELISYNLKKNGYSVDCLDNGESCLRFCTSDEWLGAPSPKLVLLDLMLPGVNGLDVCRTLKNNPATASTPIIIISAKGEDADIVSGLELGADDYLVKPFSPRVLLARVRSVLRRTPLQEFNKRESRIAYGDLAIDKSKHMITLQEKVLDVTATEFHLLALLAENPGRVYSRSQIVDCTKGDDYPVTDRSVDVQMVGLRKKLGDFGHIIETVRGVGYRSKELPL